MKTYVNFFFFFQAEDGIRDWSVTGVQTCALPISSLVPRSERRRLYHDRSKNGRPHGSNRGIAIATIAGFGGGAVNGNRTWICPLLALLNMPTGSVVVRSSG